VRLTVGQAKALNLALTSNDSLFITGSAGTGKTVVLKQIVKDLEAAGQKVLVTSFTGLAALQLGGVTLARLLGLGISKRAEDLKEDLIMVGQKAASGVVDANVLVIDEISLLSGDYLELVDFVLRIARANQEPFGGLRVIYCGDFLQLPPIRGYHEPEFRVKWAFQYPPFRDAQAIQLTECLRQGRAVDLELLNELREGRLGPLSKLFIEAALGRKIEEAIELHPRNEVVRRINQERLEQLPGESREYRTHYSCVKSEALLSKSLPIDRVLHLKVGAPVIIMVNNPAGCYCNGTQGRVVGLSRSEVQVKDLEGRLLTVTNHTWNIDLNPHPSPWEITFEKNRRMGYARGMPIKLGWAATIHKSQGLTLQRVKTDVSRCWEPGHAYVALSRTPSMLNISLVNPFRKVLADPEALRYVQSIG
jgi:ATP-dependent exoDNAse (exonuclease V) alpha subunit